ncbi:MAG: ABC transporter ATP-binding protein [Solirubrobacteraceae bacterium]
MSLVEVENLEVELPVDGEYKPVLRGVSFSIDTGEALGLVGESGSGKTMTARAIARLLPPAARVSGRVRFDDHSILELGKSALRSLRGQEIGMIFQDPRAAINPMRRVGAFMIEGLCDTKGVSRTDAERQAVEQLQAVRIADPERCLRQYPHQLSGGMLQRVMIASTLMAEPRLILADEPTTALDVTTQAEVVAILDALRRERGLSMLFISHDLELARAVTHRTAVMYAGEIVEVQASDRLHSEPLHPYSAALVASRPSIDHTLARLPSIPGRAIPAFEAPTGCPFRPRCPHAVEVCAEKPPMTEFEDGTAAARCWRSAELRTAQALKAG